MANRVIIVSPDEILSRELLEALRTAQDFIKSIVKIEFTKKRPPTLWNKVQGLEYGWYSNVNPKRPHNRWSQASEKVIPTMERRPTLPYNGYEEFVADLYSGNEF